MCNVFLHSGLNSGICPGLGLDIFFFLEGGGRRAVGGIVHNFSSLICFMGNPGYQGNTSRLVYKFVLSENILKAG